MVRGGGEVVMLAVWLHRWWLWVVGGGGEVVMLAVWLRRWWLKGGGRGVGCLDRLD